MSYSNKFSNKPFEKASKTGHTSIINDELVKSFISSCHIPPFEENLDINDLNFTDIRTLSKNPIKNIITIDGGYTDVVVKCLFRGSAPP